MALLVDCAGAPRDVGLDHGRAARAELQDRFAALPWAESVALRLGLVDPGVARIRRDLARYFPHLSETVAGLAVGADVPGVFVAREIAGELEGLRPLAAGLAGEGAQLAFSLSGPVLVRRSRPEGLFASVDLTRPWLPSALLGVNERGLAVAVAESARGEGGSCAAPAALLAQDCLERFEALDAALDWCAGRPSGGRTTLILADAAGAVAGIEIDGAERRVLRPAGGVMARDGAASDLAKTVAEAPEGSPLPDGVAKVDVGARSLVLAGATFGL